MSTLDIAQFLSSISPFHLLKSYQLEKLINQCDIAYYPKDAIILEPTSANEHFFIIAKGIVQGGADQESFFMARDSFDQQALLSGQITATFRAYEEAICYKIPMESIQLTMQENRDFGAFYRQSVTQKLSSQQDKKDVSQMALKVKDLGYDRGVVVTPETTVYDALVALEEVKGGAILVQDTMRMGIVTDTDLRRRLLLAGKSVTTPIGEIASWSTITINDDDFVFNATYLMTKFNIKRLIVSSPNGGCCGILSVNDILGAYSNQTQFVSIKIDRCHTVEDLGDIARKLPSIVQTLRQEGVKTRHIMKLVTELDTKLFAKLFDLLVPATMKNDLCLIVMGSEGRHEQIQRTDQDNGFIVRDGVTLEGLDEVAEHMTQTLLSWGYPLCDGGVMVNQPQWRKSLKEYKEFVFDAVATPTPEKLMSLAILADLRCVAGDVGLADELSSYVRHHLAKEKRILSYFAKPLESFGSSLGLFHSFILEKGSHKGEFDIKKGGIFPLMHGVRALAVEQGLSVTNTFERIKELNNLNLFDRTMASEMIEALEFLQTIRLAQRIKKTSMGQEADNYIRPSELSHFDRDLLKEALKVVEHFKKFCAAHFKLDYLA